jgi:hypothetical protein
MFAFVSRQVSSLKLTFMQATQKQAAFLTV